MAFRRHLDSNYIVVVAATQREPRIDVQDIIALKLLWLQILTAALLCLILPRCLVKYVQFASKS